MGDTPSPSAEGKGFWPDWLTPRRAWEFARRLVALQRIVERLEVENAALRDEVTQLKMSVVEHDAQLRLLTAFVRDSLSNRLETKIEKLAADMARDRKRPLE